MEQLTAYDLVWGFVNESWKCTSLHVHYVPLYLWIKSRNIGSKHFEPEPGSKSRRSYFRIKVEILGHWIVILEVLNDKKVILQNRNHNFLFLNFLTFWFHSDSILNQCETGTTCLYFLLRSKIILRPTLFIAKSDRTSRSALNHILKYSPSQNKICNLFRRLLMVLPLYHDAHWSCSSRR